MLKRTIVVLAVLAMVVSVMPAALAAGGTVDDVRVTLKQGTSTVTSGASVTIVTDNPASTTDFTDTQGTAAGGYYTVTLAGDYDADTTGTQGAPDGTAATVQVTFGGVVYYYTVTLVEAGSTGIAEVTVNLPASGTISGAVQYDSDQSATDTLVNVTSATSISVYSGGNLWATFADADGGAFSILTGSGAFTVSADITQSVATSLLGLDLQADNCDTTCPATGADADEGEVMWFSNAAAMGAAATVNVPSGTTVTGVNFAYANETAGQNAATFDHIDVIVSSFGDMAGHWAQTDAEALQGLSWVSGCDATPNFCPEGDITRAEFAAILGRQVTGGGTSVPVVVTAPYPDVATDYWAAGFIQALKVAGIVQGDASGNFNPEGKITRSEAAAMLARWIESKTTGAEITGATDTADAGTDITAADVPGGLPAATLSFVDVPTTYWAAREITALFLAGVIKGNADGTFGPEANISRAEMVALVNRARTTYSIS